MAPRVDGVSLQPDGANTAFLLVHGFCAAPDEVATLGELLFENDIASYAVRLAGHGTTPEDIATTDRHDWIRSASDALRLVRDWRPEHIFIAGLSMGGLITLRLAMANDDLSGIVAMAPALEIGGFLGKLIPLIKIFKKYRNVDLSDMPRMYDVMRVKYEREPLSAIQELLKLAKEVRRDLHKVTVPALIIQGSADKTIDPSSGQQVYDLISSTDKKLEVIEGAEHVITCHPTRHDAYPLVLDFIRKQTS